MKRLNITAVLLALMILCSCGNAGKVQKSDKIYTTFYAMYDFTREIAGDKLEVVQLVPSGSGPHDFEPTAADIADVTHSKALVYCGSVDTYIGGIKDTAEKAGVRTLDTSEGIELEDGADPHVWLSPENALRQYTAICGMLCEIDPENSEYYKSRLAAAGEHIREIDSEIKQLAAAASKHDIIVSHQAYAYLCRDLGITAHGIEGSVGGSDPTAKRMAETAQLANELGIKIIFAQKNESDKTARALAREIGGDVLLLDPFESDTGTGSYFDVMNMNIQALGTALK